MKKTVPTVAAVSKLNSKATNWYFPFDATCPTLLSAVLSPVLMDCAENAEAARDAVLPPACAMRVIPWPTALPAGPRLAAPRLARLAAWPAKFPVYHVAVDAYRMMIPKIVPTLVSSCLMEDGNGVVCLLTTPPLHTPVPSWGLLGEV